MSEPMAFLSTPRDQFCQTLLRLVLANHLAIGIAIISFIVFLYLGLDGAITI